MTLPTSEPIPTPEEQLPPARRRRQRRLVLPEQDGERERFLDELGLQATPGAEFFLSALLGGLIFAAGLLLDAPALVLLAVLLAPFMGPAIGLAVATTAGSPGFLLRSLGSLVTGGLMFFLTGTLAGWIARLLPPATYAQTGLHLGVTWPDLALATVGAGLTAYLMARSSRSRPQISSVALAYEIFLPLGAAGFALTSGNGLAWTGGLLVFAAHLLWSALVGVIVLAGMGLRPRSLAGYLLSAVYLLACLAGLVLAAGERIALPSLPRLNAPVLADANGATSTPSPAPSLTATSPENGATPPERGAASPAESSATPTAQDASLTQPTTSPTGLSASPTSTPTHTLVPTRTPTITVTPQATPVWARIHAKDGNGAYIRSDANYDAPVVTVLLNGTLVQVTQDVQDSSGTAWMKVRTADGKEGWIVRALLATATPAPGW